jgi:hypothetical protein
MKVVVLVNIHVKAPLLKAVARVKVVKVAVKDAVNAKEHVRALVKKIVNLFVRLVIKILEFIPIILANRL